MVERSVETLRVEVNGKECRGIYISRRLCIIPMVLVRSFEEVKMGVGGGGEDEMGEQRKCDGFETRDWSKLAANHASICGPLPLLRK